MASEQRARLVSVAFGLLTIGLCCQSTLASTDTLLPRFLSFVTSTSVESGALLAGAGLPASGPASGPAAVSAGVPAGGPVAGHSAGVAPLWVVVVFVLALVFGAAVGFFVANTVAGQGIKRARAEADEIRSRAASEGKNDAEKLRLEAERAAMARKEKTESELESGRAELRETERRLEKRDDLLHRKEEKIASLEQSIDDRKAHLEKVQAEAEAERSELGKLRERHETELSRVADMSPAEARDELINRVEEKARLDVAKTTRKIVDEAEEQAKEQAREITLMAIQRFATEHTSESTVRTVPIPSDDMKGRIIGREGRNIRAIEKVTGVDIIVDDTPGVIVVSSFDKVRQAVAVESLGRLIADGRMHPTRIEEVVEKVRSEINEKVIKAGKDAALETNLGGLNGKVIEAMGKLHYRTSYGQNVLRHSIEVAYFSQIIADQLGLDGKLARRCGFLHDIGKAMDHEMEGGHPKIGMDFAKQHGEKSEAVLNAIGGHHGDIPSTTFYTPIVMAADAVSSARPGARRESMERYIQRLNELQDIATSFTGVTEAYAIQAGREVRVMVDADTVGDDEAYLIAHEIAKRVSDEMTFPGEIRVTVLRETRAIELAR
ncbi:MAG: ribonuclease Y [Planctomycetota bacterium]